MTQKIFAPLLRRFTAVACDGPFNGQYITARVARGQGYELSRWPSGEHVDEDYDPHLVNEIKADPSNWDGIHPAEYVPPDNGQF